MTKSWLKTVEEVESMIPLLGQLGRENNLKIQLAGQELLANSVASLMSLFDQYPEYDASYIKQCLLELKETAVFNTTIDIETWQAEKQFDRAFVEVNNNHTKTPTVLYGFGRIGRLLTRRLCSLGRTSSNMELAAIVVRKKGHDDLRKRANLLQFDSVHGRYDGVVKVDVENQALIINGQSVKVIYASHPSEVDYQAYGIDNALLVDNTGIWRDVNGLEQHLASKGIARVLLTAPGKQMKNIVFGVNDQDVQQEDKILSAASCTTNAIAPVLSKLEDCFGIESGHVETIHAYTNDQNLIDNIHKGDRRGRAAALNMVITETGAAKAVSKAVPSLEGKLSGSAIRVPVINVSIAVLNLTLKQDVSVEDLHNVLKNASMTPELSGQIGFSDDPDAVSTDFIGAEQSGIIDSLSTKTHGKQAILYVWYDNEYGYSCQVTRLMEKITLINTSVATSTCHKAA